MEHSISATLALKTPYRALALLRGSFADNIKRAADMGFNGVELNFKAPGELNYGDIEKACSKTGLSITALATGLLYTQDGLSLIHNEESVRIETCLRLKEYIDIASRLGGKVIIGCVRGNITRNKPLSFYMKLLSESLLILLDYAKKKNTTILLEAINHYENNYLNNATSCVDFLETYNLSGIEVLLDTYHMNIEERNVCEAIKTASEYLGYIHLSDNTRHVPGIGCFDFKSALSVLRDIKYSRWLSFEAVAETNVDIEARDGLQFIRSIMGEI